MKQFKLIKMDKENYFELTRTCIIKAQNTDETIDKVNDEEKL